MFSLLSLRLSRTLRAEGLSSHYTFRTEDGKNSGRHQPEKPPVPGIFWLPAIRFERGEPELVGN